MPTGINFGSNMKQLMFRIIKFVESEKEGPVIPSYNTTSRLEIMLGFSRATVFRLRNEICSLEQDEEESNEDKIQLRRRPVSEASVLAKYSRRKRKISVDIPLANSLAKKGNSALKKIKEVCRIHRKGSVGF